MPESFPPPTIADICIVKADGADRTMLVVEVFKHPKYGLGALVQMMGNRFSPRTSSRAKVRATAENIGIACVLQSQWITTVVVSSVGVELLMKDKESPKHVESLWFSPGPKDVFSLHLEEV